jgi:hypothetical protein
MRELLVATVVGMLAVTAPLPAHADGAGFRGDCRISTVNDTTPGGTLGGPDTWTGQVDVLVVARDAGPISATCSIKVNGVDQGVLLDAGSGSGFVAAAGPATFRAAVTDTILLCTNVTTSAGYEPCAYTFQTVLCPYEVCGAGGALDQARELVASLDPAVCAQLVAAAPTVDDVPTADSVYVDPATGDTFVGGRTAADLFWDCPPYESP